MGHLENTLRWIKKQMLYTKIWDIPKSVFRGNFMTTNTYARKRNISSQ